MHHARLSLTRFPRPDNDHALAGRIGSVLASLLGVAEVLPVEINIVIFDLAEGALTATELARRLDADGCIVGAFGERRARIVTHL